MPTESLARTFFDSLFAGDAVANVRALINADPPRVECDWFDAKCENPKQKDDKNTQKIWSKVLGGFANNQGGVVVWGLEARKAQIDGQDVDAVCGELPILNPEAFRSKLIEWQRQATDPVLPNVEIVAVTLPEDKAKGFVICYIPEGAHKPYRSEYAERNYYLRAGDSTFVMSRSVLASMFHPKAKAAFKLSAEVAWRETPAETHFQHGQPNGGQLSIDLCVTNSGTATAKELSLFLRAKVPGRARPPGGGKESAVSSVGVNEFTAQNPRSLHPAMKTEMLNLRWDWSAQQHAEVVFNGSRAATLSVTIYCENQEPQTALLEFGLEELLICRCRSLEVHANPAS